MMDHAQGDMRHEASCPWRSLFVASGFELAVRTSCFGLVAVPRMAPNPARSGG